MHIGAGRRGIAHGTGQAGQAGLKRGRVGLGRVDPARILAASLLLAPLAACGPAARQDPLLVRGDSRAAAIPTISVEHSYAPASDHGRPDSRVAYTAPDTPVYRDRPLDETVRGSIELADYARALDRAGLMPWLGRPGPYTVFAVPNLPMERFAQAQAPGQGQGQGQGRAPDASPAALPPAAVLRGALGYSIVRGSYPAARLRQFIAASPTGWIRLTTVTGGSVLVGRDPAGGGLLLSDGTGGFAAIWIDGMPQSNGTLYLTRTLMGPYNGAG